MAEPFEYAIKKDVRNNPIIRVVDVEAQRDMWRNVTVGVFVVVAALAPVLAPPVANARNPYIIPQQGFAPDPRAPRPGPVPGSEGSVSASSFRAVMPVRLVGTLIT